MAEKRTIRAKEIVVDIRSGLSKPELKAKYTLSASELQKVVNSLIKAGRLRDSEVQEWHASSEASSTKSGTREMPRSYLRIPPEISDCQHVTSRGLVTDLSVRGFRTRGMASRVGGRHTFLIHASEIADIQDIELNATCKWHKAQTSDITLHEAGFLIDTVSETGMVEIRKLIQFLSIGDRNRRRG